VILKRPDAIDHFLLVPFDPRTTKFGGATENAGLESNGPLRRAGNGLNSSRWKIHDRSSAQKYRDTRKNAV